MTPHIKLQEYFPNEFHVDIDYEPELNNDSFLKQYDLIHYHRTLGAYENLPELLERCEKLGITTIMDIDDHWSPGPDHPAWSIIKQHELDKKISGNIKVSKNITTTTSIFADEIKKLNKNVFVIPNAINLDEKQYQSNPEKSEKVRIGWLGGSCMTPDTEILTNEGWKRFDELDQTETVATLNPKTNEIEYHKPTGYICEPFDGELNCVKKGDVEYEVTPNHNMYASVANSLTRKKLDLELIQSEKIHGKNFHIKKNGVWVGKEEEYFVLPMLNEYAEIDENESYVDRLISKRRNKTLIDKYGTDTSIKMDDWLQFFGFWMAEGWASKTKGLYQVGIAQVKDNGYLSYMYDLLVKMGFNPTYTKDKKQVRVFDKKLWDYLSNFGYSFDKYIPREILNLSSRQLGLFLDWFIKGDGHIDKNGRTRAYTSSPTLANDLQEIALKMGISATITNRGKRTSEIKGRAIKSQHDAFTINFTKHPSVSKHNKNTPLIRTEHQYTRPYKGNVYCVEVQNHIIHVRRNGKPMWIGNSHKHDLEILRDVVKRFKSDGLLDKVQFVLCGFDLRGSVTMIDPNTGEQRVRDIKPTESVWYEYEKIFTDNYSIVSDEYKKFLLSFQNKEYENVSNEPYRRVWTKPITTYASNYNLFDISLAPLKESNFNKVKSQLKVIEAGFHKKAIVAQDFGPYQIDVINSYERGGTINENGNGFLVETSKNHKLWYKHLKTLVENPELITKLGENLYNTVNGTYDMKTVCTLRKDLYKKLVEEMKLVTL